MNVALEVATANPYETLNWIVGSGLGFLTIAQIFFSFRKERREARQAQAKMGYELIDALFDDATGGPLLDDLDAGLENSPNLTRRTGDAIRTAQAFETAFGPGLRSESPELIAIRLRFDAVLYYLDRFEHAILADLTTFGDVSASFLYYSILLARFAPSVDWYARQIGYDRASNFLRRYPHWRAALARNPTSGG